MVEGCGLKNDDDGETAVRLKYIFGREAASGPMAEPSCVLTENKG
jgi:hypothetical protein